MPELMDLKRILNKMETQTSAEKHADYLGERGAHFLNFKGIAGAYFTELEVYRLKNLNDIIPEDTIPTMIYMVRGHSEDWRYGQYCQDRYAFDSNGQCISHKQGIVSGNEDIGGTEKPDKNIKPLLEAREAFEELYFRMQSSSSFIPKPLCNLVARLRKGV